MPVYVEYDGNSAATSGTITVANGLTATDLFGNAPYGASMTYNVTFVGASPTTLSLSLSGTSSGSDRQRLRG